MEREICGYFVVAYLHDEHLVVDFEIYEEDYNCARELFFNGHIKWDGCSNWKIPDGNYQFHFCGREGMQKFANLMQEMYDWAIELMPDKLIAEDRRS